MSWGYRVLRHKEYYGLHEVYYDKNKRASGWTTDPVGFAGETNAELIKSLELALKDAKRHPVLDVRNWKRKKTKKGSSK